MGHVEAARAAQRALDLDRVVFVVAGDPWQKAGSVEASAADRLRMTELAVQDEPDFDVSAVEIERPGPSYTVDTLEEMSRPERELVLIVGADAALGLDSWHRADRIRELATIAVLPRDDLEVTEGIPVAMEPVDVSSTEIRAADDHGPGLDAQVAAYIDAHGLYRG